MNNWREVYDRIIKDAADRAVHQAKRDALAGIFGPMRLYYKTGEVRVVNPHVLPFDVPDDFQDTGRDLQPSVPYDQYARWIRENTKDLNILPEGI